MLEASQGADRNAVGDALSGGRLYVGPECLQEMEHDALWVCVAFFGGRVLSFARARIEQYSKP